MGEHLGTAVFHDPHNEAVRTWLQSYESSATRRANHGRVDGIGDAADGITELIFRDQPRDLQRWSWKITGLRPIKVGVKIVRWVVVEQRPADLGKVGSKEPSVAADHQT